jgi:hypothetical protein
MSTFAIIELINAISVGLLGAFVYLKNKRHNINTTYALFCFFVAFWSFCYFLWAIANSRESALFWNRILMAGAIFIPISFLHFTYIFIYPPEKYADHKKTIIGGYILFFIFFVLDFTPFFIKDVSPKLSFKFWPEPGIAFIPFFIFCVYCCI